MATMFDSDVFRSSLLSLLDSDLRGEIVVAEDGYSPERVCESFCKELPVKYVKNPEWSGIPGSLNLAIEQLAPQTDIVIYAHNDVLWPRRWFDHLDDAWERVYDLDKVGIINLGYMQFRHYAETAPLHDLFVGGRYEDLIWLLRAMREVPPLMRMVKDAQAEDMGRLFGLARDVWNRDLTKLRMMTGRLSVGTSFPLQTWRNLGGFDTGSGYGVGYGVNPALQYYGLQNRKWNLWINNTPLVHTQGADTGNVPPDAGSPLVEMREAFLRKHGWEIYHFWWTYFAETLIIYYDEIINAVNELRFSDIDFVFDDCFERLQRKRLASCEFVWCPSRATCKY